QDLVGLVGAHGVLVVGGDSVVGGATAPRVPSRGKTLNQDGRGVTSGRGPERRRGARRKMRPKAVTGRRSHLSASPPGGMTLRPLLALFSTLLVTAAAAAPAAATPAEQD